VQWGNKAFVTLVNEDQVHRRVFKASPQRRALEKNLSTSGRPLLPILNSSLPARITVNNAGDRSGAVAEMSC
ncbi:hypothetical protein Q6A58_36460, partial [Pseudomonas aeruginosa]|uniref:hypothetical protein n=1 Tax=Pseudomonas aeruginosa TaxID=287 RepID=UPI002712B422